MSYLNSFLRVVFDGLLYPFRGFPPLVGLAVISLITAIGMLLVFKKTSDQSALADAKRRIHAGFFEVRLFKADLRAVLRAQVSIMTANLAYLRLSVVPMLWMIVPLVLVIAQLQFHFGYRGLSPGESTLLKVQFSGESEGGKPDIRVRVAPGVAVKTPAVWIPSLNEMAWAVLAEVAGDYDIEVHFAGKVYTKTATVSDAVIRRSPIRTDGDLLRQLLYPAEPPLPAGSPVRSIHLTYPESDVSVWVFGWRAHWLVVFFLLSIVFAFALRKRMGVTI